MHKPQKLKMHKLELQISFYKYDFIFPKMYKYR